MIFRRVCFLTTEKANLFLPSNVDKDGITIKMSRLLNHPGLQIKTIS